MVDLCDQLLSLAFLMNGMLLVVEMPLQSLDLYKLVLHDLAAHNCLGGDFFLSGLHHKGV